MKKEWKELVEEHGLEWSEGSYWRAISYLMDAGVMVLDPKNVDQRYMFLDEYQQRPHAERFVKKFYQ